MIPFVCQWIDRIAIYHAAAGMPQPDGRNLHLDEAQLLLQNLDFSAVEMQPVSVEFAGPINFRFLSPRPSSHALNIVVHGRLYRCDDRWREKPIILLLHGWNDHLNHHFFFPRHARQLNRFGVSAATLQLPWQFNRRPSELGPWGNFLSADFLKTLEAVLQALVDIQSFTGWLLEQGCQSVGLWGISLGAWLAGLAICHDARFRSAVLVTPVAGLDHLIEEAVFCKTIRCGLHNRHFDLQKLDLMSHCPVIGAENILLIEAEHDLFVARETVEDLWRAWDKPEIWRFRSGHVSILGVPGLSNRVVRWVAAKAVAPVGK